jgi:hypothetical protein
MSSTLNPLRLVHPIDECVGPSAAELGFQLKLANLAAEFLRFAS